jgi:hypothetical protein
MLQHQIPFTLDKKPFEIVHPNNPEELDFTRLSLAQVQELASQVKWFKKDRQIEFYERFFKPKSSATVLMKLAAGLRYYQGDKDTLARFFEESFANSAAVRDHALASLEEMVWDPRFSGFFGRAFKLAMKVNDKEFRKRVVSLLQSTRENNRLELFELALMDGDDEVGAVGGDALLNWDVKGKSTEKEKQALWRSLLRSKNEVVRNRVAAAMKNRLGDDKSVNALDPEALLRRILKLLQPAGSCTN